MEPAYILLCTVFAFMELAKDPSQKQAFQSKIFVIWDVKYSLLSQIWSQFNQVVLEITVKIGGFLFGWLVCLFVCFTADIFQLRNQ